MNLKAAGQVFRGARRTQKLAQQQVAECAGIALLRYGAIEHPQTKITSEIAEKIHEVL